MMPKLAVVKRLVREADHSPPFSTDIRNTWSYTCIPAYVKKRMHYVENMSRFNIVTGYGLSDTGVAVRVLGGSKDFLFSASSRPALGPTQPPIRWVLGALSPGVKRQGREADHSPPNSAEVKKMWSYTSTALYAFMAKCLIS
jgi:hypothetical protein